MITTTRCNNTRRARVLTVCRENQSIDVLDCLARANDGSFPYEKQPMVEKYAQEEQKRLVELKFSTPADLLRWHLQRCQDRARHNTLCTVRFMQQLCACVSRLRSGHGKEEPEMPLRCVRQNSGINVSYKFVTPERRCNCRDTDDGDTACAKQKEIRLGELKLSAR